ncbi:MAG: hypothetical protein E7610_01130 [Ruminococcaceae bacterium]|nr:hypothetical protein [Oscillospiraceae bacterium]
MTISILRMNSAPVYAEQEMVRFLTEYTNAVILAGEGGDRTITLAVDETMPAHHYAIDGDGTHTVIRGGNQSSVLCGVYEALADAGILFEANGYSVPLAFDLDAVFSVRKQVKPRFRLRGIRQHINFPMDISSYALKEAKEYIRSLARMRYNAITFHSYPGQWHEVRPDDPADHAGHFFYGQVHTLPEDEPLLTSRIDNKKYFCIPEVEGVFEDEAKRASFAKYWLNEIMATAKEAGMEITLSVEIITDDEEAMVKMLRAICRAYPLIDTLELISEECGGFRDQPGVTRENVKDFIVGLFGENILDRNGNLPGLPDYLPHQLGSSAVSTKRVLQAAELKARWTEGLSRIPALRVGLYLTCTDTLRVLRPILRMKRPADTTMSLLSAHGALAVTRNIEETGNLPEDWQNTMYYSWAEFDGNMFIQQMSTDGIEALANMPETESSYGYCINHWRTAENTLAITYSAQASIDGVSASDFYLSYARKLGIGDVQGFTEACRRLAALDTHNRDELFNIGFCAVSCWFNWHRRKGGMKPRGFAAEPQKAAMAEYEALVEAFGKVLPTARTREGIAFLRLMMNRCYTSILHIRSMYALDELETIYDYDDPKPLTEAQMARVHAILDESMSAAKEYLCVYGEMKPDRGTEGHLISYYVTTVAYIRAVAAAFTDAKVETREDDYDAPPMPDAEAK